MSGRDISIEGLGIISVLFLIARPGLRHLGGSGFGLLVSKKSHQTLATKRGCELVLVHGGTPLLMGPQTVPERTNQAKM
jgi:hypothetical protein